MFSSLMFGAVVSANRAGCTDREPAGSLSMTWRKGRRVVPVAIALALCEPMMAVADVTIPQEYGKTIKSAEAVGVLGNDLFGEQTNFYTGATTFSSTDVQLVGNNTLPVAIGRVFTVTARDQIDQANLLRQDGGFADWDLDIPHLHGVFAAGKGWQVDGWDEASSNNRCSLVANMAEPPIAGGGGANPGAFAAAEYWSGNSLYVPGMGNQEMLVLDPSVNPRAPADGQAYTWVTNNQWYFSCLPTTANGVPGDAFLAHAPDGTRYFFNWVAKRQAPLLAKRVSVPIDAAAASTTLTSKQKHQRKTGGVTPQIIADPEIVVLSREEVWILPTRVEDRFGNSVTYTYDSTHPMRLTSISASDGRSLSIGYNSDGHISTVTSGNRTWSYVYGNGLTQVALPDQSAWTIDFSRLRAADTRSLSSPPDRLCEYPGSSPVQDTYTGTITHPSGAVGTFSFKSHLHGRSYVPKTCIRSSTDPSVQNDFAWRPKFFDAIGLIQKTNTGPGTPTQQWSYTYGPSVASWESDCPNESCSSTKVVEVSGTGEYKRYTFGTRYGRTEGKLLKVEMGTSSSNILNTVDTTYALDPAGQPYPTTVGYSPYSRGDRTAERLTPVVQRQIAQDGVTFSSQVTQFDGFARPLASTKWSSLGYTRTETTEYEDNLNRWVLGQVKRTTANGAETGRTIYDSSTAMPLRSYGPCATACPGKLQQALNYNTTAPIESGQRGTPATITDGRDNTTALSNWKRGIPQNIQYADGKSQSAVVNDAGWIMSVTDERSNTTRYDYDLMGRLKLIDYADGDTVDWANTTLSFEQINDAEEYGIPAGHWRQTVNTGNARKTTYFDALWRPLVEREEDITNPASVRVSAKRYDHEGRVADAYYPQDGSYTSHAQFTRGAHTSYDALGRVTETRQDAEGGQVLTTTTKYEPGFETLVTNPRQQQSRTRYAALDQPTYDYPVKQFLPEGAEVTIARDVFFKPTQLTHSGTDGTSVDRFYFYDEHQRLCRLFEPETGSTVTDYDAAGNVSWTASGLGFWGEGCHREDVADANRIKRTYDLRNRPTYIDYPAGTDDIVLGYEPTGEVQLAQMGGSEWRYTRNKRGLVEKEALTLDDETRSLGYAYTPGGHLASIAYPRGRTIAYAPNALGQPTQAGSYVADVRYWPEGDPKSFRYANGITYSSQKNARRLPSNRTYASGTGSLLYSQDLSYDPNANLSGVNDLAGTAPSRSKTMTYDGLDRLKTASAPGLWGSESYTYDALDNIRSRVKDGQTYDYVYDGLNRLRDLKIGNTAVHSYWYDLQGNTICRQTDGCLNGGTLTFDLANRLQRYDGVQSYRYDAWGRRVTKTNLTSGADTSSLYSQGGQLMLEHDSAANTINDYVYLGKTMVAKVSSTLPLLAAPSTSGGGVTLSWPTSGSAVRYIVEESANFGAWTTVYDGTATTWSASGRTPGTYRYRIKACTADGACTTYTSTVTVKVMPDLTPIIYELLLN